MTDQIHIEPATVTDLATILVPYNKHSKLARCVAEFFIEEHTRSFKVQENIQEVSEPRIDTRTLRRFVDFLIAKKGYN